MISFSSLHHHAILVTHSDRKKITESLWNDLQKNIANKFYDQTVLDIDTARALITWANTPYNDKKIALVSFHSITLPAQNALLKIIEEPREGIQFILVTTNKQTILPTLLSRVEHTHIDEFENKEDISLAKLFLKTPHTERMKLPSIVTLLERTDEEKRKDREAIQNFIFSLVPLLTANKIQKRYVLETLEIASYASDPSASGKALLEYLSLLLPQIS